MKIEFSTDGAAFKLYEEDGSTDIKYESGKEDFVWWINNVAIPKLEVGVREGGKKFWFGSESGFYTCEADDRDSGGYLYCGFYSTKEYDEMIKE